METNIKQLDSIIYNICIYIYIYYIYYIFIYIYICLGIHRPIMKNGCINSICNIIKLHHGYLSTYCEKERASDVITTYTYYVYENTAYLENLRPISRSQTTDCWMYRHLVAIVPGRGRRKCISSPSFEARRHKMFLRHGESNPGLPRDRRGY